MHDIKFSIAPPVATITLARPERLNAFTQRMADEIVTALDAADADDRVRAIVFTGEGRAFCAGSDLDAGGKTFDPGEQGDDAAPRDGGGVVALRLFACHKPIIAAVNGAAVGVGVTMTLPMDVRIAAPAARFGFVFTRRGIVPEAASSWFLPRLVGTARALDWTITGRVFGAEEALAGGLVTELVDDPVGRATSLATEIAETTSAVSVALTRQLLWRGWGHEHPMLSHRADSRAMFLRGRSADAREGVTSFLEKRSPEFTDRIGEDLPRLFEQPPGYVDGRP